MAESQNSLVRIGLGIVEKKPIVYRCFVQIAGRGDLSTPGRASKSFKTLKYTGNSHLWIVSSEIVDEHNCGKPLSFLVVRSDAAEGGTSVST